MATFISGFAKGFSEARDRSLKREMFLGEQQEKKSRILAPLKTSSAEQLQRIEDSKAKLLYLKQRGFSDDRLEAIGQDPDLLEGVYEFAAVGAGADMSEEELSNIYRAVPIQNVEGDGLTVFERYQQAADTYKEVMAGNVDPTDFTPPNPYGTRTYTLEDRPPAKPEDLGISANRQRTEKWQLDTFDKTLMSFALRDLEKASAGGDVNARVELSNLIDNYSTDLAARARLTDRYRDSVLKVFDEQGIIEGDPDGFAGFENNLMIFDPLSEAAADQFKVTEQLNNPPPGPEGASHYNSAINPDTGIVTHFYQMPDGSFISIEGN